MNSYNICRQLIIHWNGGGFDGPEWSVRVSLANLNEKDYIKIGLSIRRILNEYADKWKSEKN